MAPKRSPMPWWQWKRAEKALATWVRSLIGERPYTVIFREGEGSYVAFTERLIVVEPTLPDSLGGPALVPCTWRGRPVTTLAALQWRAARALARHEAAHVLFTQPSRRDRDGALHWLFNSLEDGRIERYLASLYPWCWGDFVELGRMVWRQFALPDSHPQRLLAACLLHRWDVLRPRTSPSRITFADDAARALWEERVRPLVEEAWAAPESERVVEIALEILGIAGVGADERASALGMPANPLDRSPRGERGTDDPPLPHRARRPRPRRVRTRRWRRGRTALRAATRRASTSTSRAATCSCSPTATSSARWAARCAAWSRSCPRPRR